MDWQEELISLYVKISKIYQQKLTGYCCRMSNYANLEFSDEEIITIYMFGVMSNNYKIKDIYDYTDRHLRGWFPKLPSYTAFIQRLNKLADSFIAIAEILHEQIPVNESQKMCQLIDSMPIILAHRGRRFKAKVAPEIATANGYCATKKLHYYGVKLHVLAGYKQGSLPVPSYVGLTEAGMADLKAYECILPVLQDQKINIFADKAYQTQDKAELKTGKLTLYTPVKKKKGQEFIDAADQLFSTAVSKIRQPIESLFNWLEEKTKVQIASKVRSYNGLMVHVFGKLSSAFFLLSQKFSS